MLPSLTSLLVFLTPWGVTAVPNNGKCYGLDRVQDGEFTPCNPEAEVSSCCWLKDTCLSNGICKTSNDTAGTPYFTGLCTDYSWNSPSECLEICDHNKTRQVIIHDTNSIYCCSFDREKAMLTSNTFSQYAIPQRLPIEYATKSICIDPIQGNGIQPCGNGFYCCYGYGPSGCCSNSSSLFYLGSGPVSVETNHWQILTTTIPTTSAFLSTSSSILSSSTPPTPSDDSLSPATTVDTPSSSAHPTNDHVKVAIGLGVGLPVGLVLLAGLIYLIRRSKIRSENRDGIQAYLDNKKELDVAEKVTHGAPELAEDCRPWELSGQGLGESQHPHELSAVETDQETRS